MRYKSITIFFILLLGFSGRAQEASLVKFDYHQGLIFLEVQTRSDTLLALFDTGAEVSAIDPKTAGDLDLKVVDTTIVTGTDVSIRVQTVALPKLKLGKYVVEKIFPTSRDLGHSLSPFGRHLDLILGNDFFTNSVVEIKFPEKELTISKNMESKKYDFWIPFSLDHNIPRFSGMVNDSLPLEFRLDTGASLFETEDIYINITTGDLNRIKKQFPELEPVSYLSATGINNKPFKLAVYKLNNLQVGPLEICKPFAIVQPEAGYFAMPEAVGFLSNNFLSKYGRVAIDYRNNRLYFDDKTEASKK